MRYLRQFMIIAIISLVGEVLYAVIPLPVPASIYGLVIMLLLLCTKILSLDSIKETGIFLVEIMPILFIPPAVGLMDSWGTLRPILLPVLLIILVVTVVVMVISGHVTQFIIRKRGKEDE